MENKKTKKICIITPGKLPVPAIKGGAVETLVNNFIDLNEEFNNFDLTIISIYEEQAMKLSFKYNKSKFVFIKKNILSTLITLGLKVINRIKKVNIPNSYYELMIYKNIKNENFDLILVEGGDIWDYSYISSKVSRNKMVAHLHGNNTSNEKTDNIYGSVISISKFVKKNWDNTSRINNENSFVVLNGIDVDKFNRDLSEREIEIIKKDLMIKSEDFVVLFCGRLIEEKGIRELITSIKNINNSNIKLVIIGSPNFGKKVRTKFSKELKNLVKSFEKQIKFTGYIHNNDLYKYYRIADVAVMPSMWDEPAGLVAIEALASKCPLIVTKVGGLVEYTDNKSTIQIDRDDYVVDNIMKAIEELRLNVTKREKLKSNSIRFVNNYNSESYYKNLSKTLEYIINA